MVYRGQESQLEKPAGHQGCVPHGEHSSQQSRSYSTLRETRTGWS